MTQQCLLMGEGRVQGDGLDVGEATGVGGREGRGRHSQCKIKAARVDVCVRRQRD